jgi:probable rRNA maturation factor
LNLEEAELSILLTSDQEMTSLNSAYRGKNRTTDVLSFAQQEGIRNELHPEVLGDVVISVPTALSQAQKRNVDLFEELCFLMVHGVLHLIGFEHVGVERSQANKMRREQNRLVDLLQRHE